MNGVTFSAVPKTNPELVVIVCSGKSVSEFNLKNIPDTATIIAVNGAGKFCPRIDYWFTSDPWGLDGKQLPLNKSCEMWAAVNDTFATKASTIKDYKNSPNRNVKFLQRIISHNRPNVSSETAYSLCLSEDSRCISAGNSGYGAINFAYHLGAKNIIILGMDGDIGYFYSNTEKNRPLTYLQQMIDSTVDQITKSGITVINASPNSVISTYPKMTPEQAFIKVCGQSYTAASHPEPLITTQSNGVPIIACVLKRSPTYTVEYVNNLYNMVKSNTTIDFEFYCFTDDRSDLISDIKVIPLKNGYSGWWNKIELFNKENLADRNIFFMDLDTIIVGNIDHIISRKYNMAGLRDFYHPDRFASGLMAWTQKGKYKIYERFVLSAASIIRNSTMGDQEYIGKCVGKEAEFLQDIFPNQIVSYKAHCLKRGEDMIPEGARIICFHGTPKPQDLKINSVIKKYWTVNGND